MIVNGVIKIQIQDVSDEKKLDVIEKEFEEAIALIANNHLCDLDRGQISKITKIFIQEHENEWFKYKDKLIIYPFNRLDVWFCRVKHSNLLLI